MSNILDWMEKELIIANQESGQSKDCTLELAKLIDNYKKADPDMDIMKICDQLKRLEQGLPLTPITNNPEDWEYVDEEIGYTHRRIPGYRMIKSDPKSDITLCLDRFVVCDMGPVMKNTPEEPSYRKPTDMEMGFVEGIHPITFPYFRRYLDGTLYVDCSVPDYEAFLYYRDECTGQIIHFNKMIRINKNGEPEQVTNSEFFQAYAKVHPEVANDILKKEDN